MAFKSDALAGLRALLSIIDLSYPALQCVNVLMIEISLYTAGTDGRLLATMDFLREVAKIGGIRHEVSAIYKRWVSGRGYPSITGAYFYNR
jgi:hypothetical protein